MANKIIRCASALHAGRAANDGNDWRDNLGTYSGVVPPVFKCMRCSVQDRAASESAEDVDRMNRKAAVDKLVAATGLTKTQVRALFDAKDKGEV